MTDDDTPDATSRHLRGLYRDVMGLIRPGPESDVLRGLAERLNTGIALARKVEITRDEALAETLEDKALEEFAQVGPPPLLPPPPPHPIRLSADLMAVRRDVQGQLDRIIAAQQQDARARRGEGV